MARGKVKHIDCSKGWGFITPDEPSADALFFHKSKCRRPDGGNSFMDLATGDAVEFSVVQSERGDRSRLNAVDVRLAA